MADTKIVRLRSEELSDENVHDEVAFEHFKQSLNAHDRIMKAEKALHYASQMAEIAGYNMAGVVHRADVSWVILLADGLEKKSAEIGALAEANRALTHH